MIHCFEGFTPCTAWTVGLSSGPEQWAAYQKWCINFLKIESWKYQSNNFPREFLLVFLSLTLSPLSLQSPTSKTSSLRKFLSKAICSTIRPARQNEYCSTEPSAVYYTKYNAYSVRQTILIRWERSAKMSSLLHHRLEKVPSWKFQVETRLNSCNLQVARASKVHTSAFRANQSVFKSLKSSK